MTVKVILSAVLSSLCLLAFSQSATFLMNESLTNVNSCSGFFMDSGGGTDSYGPNQHFTTTICPAGSSGTHVQLVFNGTDLEAGDNLCFFDGQTTAAPSLGCAGDFGGNQTFIIQATAVNSSGCLTITFDSDDFGEGQGWSAKINCIPACQTILSVLDHTNPEVVPADTGWIDICPGDRVFFWGKGSYPQDGAVYNHSDLTSSFSWDFGDGASTVGPNVSKIYNKPGGYIVQLTIKDQLGCKNTNFISQRIRVAPRPEYMLGDYPDKICVNDTVNLGAIVNAVDSSHTLSVMPTEAGFQTAGIRSDSLPLPDGNGASYSTSVNFSGFAPGQILEDINDLLGIWVNMEHSWMRDLQIKLTCPNGQSAVLHNHPGQTGSEVFLGIPYEADEGYPVPIPGVGWDYGWTPNPDHDYTWIGFANYYLPHTLPSGSYQSYDPLTNFLGCPLNGQWTIQVTDLWPIDNGYIFSWSINFDPDLYPKLEVFSPDIIDWNWSDHPSIFFSSIDSIAASPSNAGEITYTFQVHDSFGCAWDTLVNIQTLPATHPDCHSCEEVLSPVGDTAICPGEQVSFNVFAPFDTSTVVTFESHDNYPIGNSNHPPANPYNSVINVNSIFPTTITNPIEDIVSVCLDLNTDFDADIQLMLRAPNNQTILLSSNNGGSGDNYTNTCFTPTAVTPITAGAPPFTGEFLPQGSWNVLNGSPINGAWALRVSDAFGINAMGKLNWWSISFRTQNNIAYTWSPSTGLSCSNCPNPTVAPTVSTPYIVTAHDNYGCTTADTAQISILGSFAEPEIHCITQSDGSVLVSWDDVVPGLSYEININGAGWINSNNGLLSHLVFGLMNGDVLNIEVRVKAPPVNCGVDIGTISYLYKFCTLQATTGEPGPFAVSCNSLCDASVPIAISGGMGPFTLNVLNQTTSAQFSQADSILSGLCPGSYLVIVEEDFDGCQDTLSFVVSDQSAIVVTAVQDSSVSCNGGSDGCATATATGGAGGFTFLWNNPNMSTGASICTLPAGSVMVTAMDANGCTGAAQINISEPAPMDLTISKTDVKCKGDTDGSATINASGGTPPYSYQWSGGDNPTQQTVTGLSAGVYSLTVTDSKGCQAFGNMTIGEPGISIDVTAFQTLTSCFGLNQSQAVAVPMGGAGGYSYLWTPGGQTNPAAENLAPGTYTVVVTDLNGCSASSDVSISQWNPINVSISFSPPSCHGVPDGEMAANIVTGGDGQYNYLWSNGQTNDYINGLSGGVAYDITVTDSQGCTGQASRFLDDPPALQINFSATDASCAGSEDGAATVTGALNAKLPLEYQWGPAAANQTTATAGNLAAGTYSVVVTDANGCTGSGVTTVGEPPQIKVAFDITNNKCFGEEMGVVKASITGGVGGYSIQWSNGQNTDILENLAADKYYLTITDNNGCTKLDSAFVSAPNRIVADFEIRQVSCFGKRDGAITILPGGGTQPYTYSLDGNIYSGSSTIIALKANDYRVHIKDSRGCLAILDVAVQEPPLMTADIIVNGQFTDEYILNYGDSIYLDAAIANGQGDLLITWDANWCGTLYENGISDCDNTPTSQTVLAKPDYSNDYFLFVIDEMGCEAEARLQVHVKKRRLVEVPTGFTPNNDGKNDLLCIHGRSGTTIKLFQVFDRWGELVFQDIDIPINDITRGWDGTFRSKDMPSGVYIWYLEAEYDDGMKDSFKGETTLIR